MIVACSKPSEDPVQKTNSHSLNQSLMEEKKLPRTNSAPNLSRTPNILEANMLMDDLDKLPHIPTEDISLSLMNEFKKPEKIIRNNLAFQNSLIKHQKEEITEDNLSDHKVKSNASNTPMRCNYLLKSDVCKSSSRSNFYYSHQEESPMLNYYGGVPTLNKRPSANNDYMLFVKKPKRDLEIDFNAANYFAKNTTNKKEIMISRYTEDDELVEYVNTPSIVHEEEEESVTVEMTINLKTNKSNNYNHSNSSDSALLFKQLPSGLIDKPQQQRNFVSQTQPIESPQMNQTVLQQSSHKPKLDVNTLQHPNILKQQQPSERGQPFDQINQPLISNNNLLDPYLLNNYMYANFLTNQNMIFQVTGGNNGMNQYYQLPTNNYPPFHLMNRMPYPMMNNNLNINPQMQQPGLNIKMNQQQQQVFPISMNQPQVRPQPQSQINNIPQYNPNINIIPQYNLNMSNTNNMNGSNINSNNNKRQLKQQPNDYSNYSDESLAQLAPFLIKEQTGCRYIQDKVSSDHHFANNILFPHLKEEIIELVCDPFGNYLFQVLIDVLIQENIEAFLNLITSSFYQICVSPHGTRVVQKIIDKIPTNLALLGIFNHMLSIQLIDTCKDPYGNHIIQKYLSDVNYPHNQFVYDCIDNNFIDISNSKHGCCVIQKGICEGNENQRKHIFDMINKHLFELITDQFGNYTIQYIFSSHHQYNISSIISTVLDNIVYLCMQKYSSNVLEKCFENSNKEIQKMLIKELVKDDNIISELISDSYGNYVIQKALLVNRDENYFHMLNVIAANIAKIKKQNFGSKLIAKLLVTHKELGNMITSFKKDKDQNSINSNSNVITYNNNNIDNNNGYYIPNNGGTNTSNQQGKNFNNSYSNHNYTHNNYKNKLKDRGNSYKR